MVDLNGPGLPSCPVPRRPAFGSVALSPDGGVVVYTNVSYREDGIEVATELVARELVTGSEYFRLEIGGDGDQIVSMSFDGERVAYLRRSVDGTSSVAVVDLAAAGAAQPVDLAEGSPSGSVSFARLPLAQG
jgi:hypothetical protein